MPCCHSTSTPVCRPVETGHRFLCAGLSLTACRCLQRSKHCPPCRPPGHAPSNATRRFTAPEGEGVGGTNQFPTLKGGGGKRFKHPGTPQRQPMAGHRGQTPSFSCRFHGAGPGNAIVTAIRHSRDRCVVRPAVCLYVHKHGSPLQTISATETFAHRRL